MADIVTQKYSLSLKLDSPITHPYKVRRDFRVVVTGDQLTFTYEYSPGHSTFWYAELSGWYPLHTPEPVCECSPGVLKQRQGVSVRIGHPYSQEEAHVPAWAYRLAHKHAPEWFPNS